MIFAYFGLFQIDISVSVPAWYVHTWDQSAKLQLCFLQSSARSVLNFPLYFLSPSYIVPSLQSPQLHFMFAVTIWCFHTQWSIPRILQSVLCTTGSNLLVSFDSFVVHFPCLTRNISSSGYRSGVKACKPLAERASNDFWISCSSCRQRLRKRKSELPVSRDKYFNSTLIHSVPCSATFVSQGLNLQSTEHGYQYWSTSLLTKVYCQKQECRNHMFLVDLSKKSWPFAKSILHYTLNCLDNEVERASLTRGALIASSILWHIFCILNFC